MLVAIVAQSVVILLLTVMVLLVNRQQEKRIQQILASHDEYVESLKDSHRTMVHHLVTMRKEGFSLQPEDQSFGAYRITPEMEADIEQQRRGEA